jgi:CheY-like chemotaxis protein
MARILLVEDNELNRDMLSQRLSRRGHQVLEAADGEAALALAANHLFSVSLRPLVSRVQKTPGEIAFLGPTFMRVSGACPDRADP